MGFKMSTTPDKIISLMQTKVNNENGNIFILGSFDRRVTFYSQQVRAFNLIYSLFHEQLLEPNDRIAIVGGGIAGVSAAAAAAFKGCQVTILEKEHEILHLQSNNTTRWIHPFIYDWPLPETMNNESGLPLFNWEANYAADVMSFFKKKWDELQNSFPHKVRVLTNCKLKDNWHQGSRGWKLSWNSDGTTFDEQFKVVIFATGFGVESYVDSNEFSHLKRIDSYWDNDSLAQYFRGTASSPKKILVSGVGDGGLIEVLRLRLKNFRQEELVGKYLSVEGIENLKEKLIKIELGIQHKGFKQASAVIEDEYRNLDLAAVSNIDKIIADNLRDDTEVAINSTEFFLTPNSSILNRLLVSRLLFSKSKVAKFIGHLTVDGIHRTPDGRYKIKTNVEEDVFDDFVLRHGAVSVIKSEFKNLYQWCSQLEGAAKIDLTREKVWEENDINFFDLNAVKKKS